MWEIESSSEYLHWWRELSLTQQKSIDRILRQLAEQGPNLPVRYSKKVVSSRHGRMRELRVQSDGTTPNLLCL